MKFTIKETFHIHVARVTKKIPKGPYETTDGDMIRALKNCQEAVEIQDKPEIKPSDSDKPSKAKVK